MHTFWKCDGTMQPKDLGFQLIVNKLASDRWYVPAQRNPLVLAGVFGRIVRNNTALDRICAGIEVELERHCRVELHIFLQTLWTMVGSYTLQWFISVPATLYSDLSCENNASILP